MRPLLAASRHTSVWRQQGLGVDADQRLDVRDVVRHACGDDLGAVGAAHHIVLNAHLRQDM